MGINREIRQSPSVCERACSVAELLLDGTADSLEIQAANAVVGSSRRNREPNPQSDCADAAQAAILALLAGMRVPIVPLVFQKGVKRRGGDPLDVDRHLPLFLSLLFYDRELWWRRRR
jgi:hypothetical protein